jgi:hypothetical protein
VILYCDKNKFSADNAFCNTKAVQFGDMDNVVREFCASHPDSEFCSCFTALNNSITVRDPTLKAILSRPECYVTKCASGDGYKTTNMRQSGQCPPVNVCQNTLNSIGNTSTELTGVTQSCDQQQQSQTSQTSQTPVSTPVSTPVKTSLSQNIFYFILFIVALFVAGFTARKFLFAHKEKNGQNATN